ncbi:MAG: hydroxyacylglutathione hydrolase family protein [Candidatus Sumerlaeaceae bacterium]|jgi:glyoxylase-like metal-dependent hydrolase (beta-lactamase superfamily II)
MGLYVRHFRLTCELANTYVACDGATGVAWLVDVGEMSDRLIDWIRQSRLRVVGIFITHAHYDHNGAVDSYIRLFPGAKVYGGSQACAPGKTMTVSDGTPLEIGSVGAVAFHVPGHTAEHMVLYVPSAGVLFSGDALFAGSVGGTSNEAAKHHQLEALRQKVLALPPTVVIYPGHGPPTSVRIESQANPFFH